MLKRKIIKILPYIFLVVVLISFTICAAFSYNSKVEETEQTTLITIWQIDGFEGGKGSRKNFLKRTAENYFNGESTYVNVVSLSQNSARNNILHSNMPDIISYSPSFYGLESVINNCDFSHMCWCYGAYFILSLDMSADFSDVLPENTVVNEGTGNCVDVIKVLLGLTGAESLSSNEAYLKLVEGAYKYLLGTQRDIYRLKARGCEYKYCVVEEFNDLYQLVSIFATDKEKYNKCLDFINYLCESDVSSLGLYSMKNNNFADCLPDLTEISFNYTISFPASEDFTKQITSACKNNDLKKLKILLQ